MLPDDLPVDGPWGAIAGRLPAIAGARKHVGTTAARSVPQIFEFVLAALGPAVAIALI